MTTPLPGALTYGTVRWSVVGTAEDGLDVDANPEGELINGTVTFIATPSSIQSAQSPPVTVLPRPMVYKIINGILRDAQGRSDISLVANDSPGMSPQGWTYKVTYELDGGYTFGSFNFTLNTGEVVDLTLEVPLAASEGVVITRGPKGDPGPGYGGGFVAPPVDGNLPLPITIVSNWGVKDDGTAYYNSAGAPSAEAGLLVPDPQTGSFTIWRPGSPFGTALDARVRDLVNQTSPSNSLLRTALNTLYAGTVTDAAASKATLAAATDAATASTLMRRDANGRVKTADGVVASDSATKGQMDTALGLKVNTSLLGANSGVATLDAAGKLPTAQLPPLAINDTFVVASQAAMLALTAQIGDMARRTDLTPARLFVLAAADATVLSNWIEITAGGGVTSVDGLTGTVALGAVAATADSLARRGSGGTLLVATATQASEATTLAQTQSLDSAAIVTARQETLARSLTQAITLVAADAGQIVLVGNSSTTATMAVNVPTNTSVPFPVGTKVDVCASGVGELLVVPASGVTLRGDRLVRPNYGVVRLQKIGADEWLIIDISNQFIGTKLPTIRVIRTDGTGYNSSSLWLPIPWNGVDAAQTYDPFGDFTYDFASFGAERRITLVRGGLYLFDFELATTQASVAHRIGVFSTSNSYNPANDNPNTIGSMNGGSGVFKIRRMPAGAKVGCAVQQGGSDVADGTNGYKSHFVITRLGD